MANDRTNPRAGRGALEHVRELIAADPELQAEYERLAPRWEAITALIRARLAEGLTQRQLADRMGVSQAVVSRLESAEHSPRLESLQRAADALGYDLEVRFKRRTRARRAAEAPASYRETSRQQDGA